MNSVAPQGSQCRLRNFCSEQDDFLGTACSEPGNWKTSKEPQIEPASSSERTK